MDIIFIIKSKVICIIYKKNGHIKIFFGFVLNDHNPYIKDFIYFL